MGNLPINLFLIPGVALLATIVLYIKLLQRVADKHSWKRFICFMIVVSYILNLIWELLQIPLYQNMIFKNHELLCALASVADVIMVLLIYFLFALMYKDPFWIRSLSFKRLIFLMAVGTGGAILSEMRHLSAGNWTYSESMPLLPIVNVGVSPVLQFCILPGLIYYFASNALKLKY